jgi:hypothetical protein
LILVDLAARNPATRADFYILNLEDWLEIVDEELRKPEARIDAQKKVTYVRDKDGKPYVDWTGVNINLSRVNHCKDQWHKIMSKIDPEKTEAPGPR